MEIYPKSKAKPIVRAHVVTLNLCVITRAQKMAIKQGWKYDDRVSGKEKGKYIGRWAKPSERRKEKRARLSQRQRSS